MVLVVEASSSEDVVVPLQVPVLPLWEALVFGVRSRWSREEASVRDQVLAGLFVALLLALCFQDKIPGGRR